MSMNEIATTVCCVRKNNVVCMGCDGQITRGEVITKRNNVKIKRLDSYPILIGATGPIKDSKKLIKIFEEEISVTKGDMLACMASIESIIDEENSKSGKINEAILIVANESFTYIVSGEGEVVESDSDVEAVGSGGMYAFAAATAMCRKTNLDAEEIVNEAIEISSQICVYTNSNITTLTLR